MNKPRWKLKLCLALEIFGYVILLAVDYRIALGVYLIHWSANLAKRVGVTNVAKEKGGD